MKPRNYLVRSTGDLLMRSLGVYHLIQGPKAVVVMCVYGTETEESHGNQFDNGLLLYADDFVPT